MKTRRLLILPLILALGACAPTQTLEELEFQALQSGDWSAVEKRERAMIRRAARENEYLDCPDGYIEFCDSPFGDRKCSCVSRRSMDDLFGWDY